MKKENNKEFSFGVKYSFDGKFFWWGIFFWWEIFLQWGIFLWRRNDQMCRNDMKLFTGKKRRSKQVGHLVMTKLLIQKFDVQKFIAYIKNKMTVMQHTNGSILWNRH